MKKDDLVIYKTKIFIRCDLCNSFYKKLLRVSHFHNRDTLLEYPDGYGRVSNAVALKYGNKILCHWFSEDELEIVKHAAS